MLQQKLFNIYIVLTAAADKSMNVVSIKSDPSLSHIYDLSLLEIALAGMMSCNVCSHYVLARFCLDEPSVDIKDKVHQQ